MRTNEAEYKIRVATADDAAAIMHLLVAVAAEDRWIRTTVPFDVATATSQIGRAHV